MADVERWGGENRFETAAQVAAGAFADGADTAFIATGAEFADALAGVPVAALESAPILLVTSDDVPDATGAELQRLEPAGIVVLGGTVAIGEQVVEELDTYRRTD